MALKLRICVRFASTFNVVRVAVLTYDLVICKDSNDCLGYTLFINNFETFGIRGVAIYIKKGITANQIHLTNCADDTAWVEIKMKNKEKLIIGGVVDGRKIENVAIFWQIITNSSN